MKYLKSYKIFENHGSLIHDIEDICQDIKDEGIDIHISADGVGYNIMFKKLSSNPSKFPMSDADSRGNKQYSQPIRYQEVKDTCDRLISYMVGSGYKLNNIQGFDARSSWEWNDNESIWDSENNYAVMIRFVEVIDSNQNENKVFESKRDPNESITDVVMDICQDLVDGDFDIECFTVGRGGPNPSSDSDIVLFINPFYSKSSEEKQKSFKLVEVLPYIKRVVEYMESEGRYNIGIDLDAVVGSGSRSRLIKVSEALPDKRVRGLDMKFRKDKIDESKIFEAKVGDIKTTCEDILLDLKDEGYQTKITINDWASSHFRTLKPSEFLNSETNWINIQVVKDGEWTTTVDQVMNRLTEYLKSEGLTYLQSQPKVKIAGTGSAGLPAYYSYDITFHK